MKTVTLRTTKAPPLKMHLAPSRAESGPGVLHPETPSPESKRCTLVLPLTAASLTRLRSSEATEGLYLLSKTADHLCEHWSSTGHSRPALSPTGRRTAKRGSVRWAPWPESTYKTHHLLVPLHAGCSSNDPPLQGLLLKTADRRLFSFQFLSASLRTIFFRLSSLFYLLLFYNPPLLSVLPLSSGPEHWGLSWGFLWFSSRVAVSTQPGREGATWNHHREGLPFTHSYSGSAEDRLSQPREGRYRFGFRSCSSVRL